jgi:hypothetical protein
MSGPLCAEKAVSVYPSPSPGSSLTITAPTGTNISKIDFANFGNSTGVCGQYTDGSCTLYPDANVKSLISTACVGKNTCSVPIDPSTFGTLTPPSDLTCLNYPNLSVQYRTSNPSPSPSNSPAS